MSSKNLISLCHSTPDSLVQQLDMKPSPEWSPLHLLWHEDWNRFHLSVASRHTCVKGNHEATRSKAITGKAHQPCEIWRLGILADQSEHAGPLLELTTVKKPAHNKKHAKAGFLQPACHSRFEDSLRPMVDYTEQCTAVSFAAPGKDTSGDHTDFLPSGYDTTGELRHIG